MGAFNSCGKGAFLRSNRYLKGFLSESETNEIVSRYLFMNGNNITDLLVCFEYFLYAWFFSVVKIWENLFYKHI